MKVKSVIFICSLFAVLRGMAGTIVLSPIGELSPVGSEASTNLLLSIDRERFHGLRVAFAFEATATNGVEIAVGEDADGDGRLSVWEGDWTFGFDCGRWIGTDAEGIETENLAAPTAGRVVRILRISAERFAPNWNLLRVTRRGDGDIGESVTVEHQGKYLYLKVR